MKPQSVNSFAFDLKWAAIALVAVFFVMFIGGYAFTWLTQWVEDTTRGWTVYGITWAVGIGSAVGTLALVCACVKGITGGIVDRAADRLTSVVERGVGEIHGRLESLEAFNAAGFGELNVDLELIHQELTRLHGTTGADGDVGAALALLEEVMAGLVTDDGATIDASDVLRMRGELEDVALVLRTGVAPNVSVGDEPRLPAPRPSPRAERLAAARERVAKAKAAAGLSHAELLERNEDAVLNDGSGRTIGELADTMDSMMATSLVMRYGFTLADGTVIPPFKFT